MTPPQWIIVAVHFNKLQIIGYYRRLSTPPEKLHPDTTKLLGYSVIIPFTISGF